MSFHCSGVWDLSTAEHRPRSRDARYSCRSVWKWREPRSSRCRGTGHSERGCLSGEFRGECLPSRQLLLAPLQHNRTWPYLAPGHRACNIRTLSFAFGRLILQRLNSWTSMQFANGRCALSTSYMMQLLMHIGAAKVPITSLYASLAWDVRSQSTIVFKNKWSS